MVCEQQHKLIALLRDKALWYTMDQHPHCRDLEGSLVHINFNKLILSFSIICIDKKTCKDINEWNYDDK